MHSRDDEFEDDDSFDELVVGSGVDANTADVLGGVAGFPTTPHIHDARCDCFSVSCVVFFSELCCVLQ